MSAADWFLAAAIVFAVGGTAAILGIARRQFNRDRARWAARFARPLTLVHPGEPDMDEGVDGDSIARLKRSQRKLNAELAKIIRDGEQR